MIEDHAQQFVVGAPEHPQRKLGIERAGRSGIVRAAPAPGDHAVGKLPAAVFADYRFLAQMEEKAGVVGQLGAGLFHRRDDARFQRANEFGLGPSPMDADRAGSMMRVRGVDQELGRRNAARLFDFFGTVRDHLPGDEQHVAADDGKAAAARLLDHSGHGPQLPLLPMDVNGPEHPAQLHFVVGGQIDGRGATRSADGSAAEARTAARPSRQAASSEMRSAGRG